MGNMQEKLTLEATVVDLAQRLTAARFRIDVLDAQVERLKQQEDLAAAAKELVELYKKRQAASEARINGLEKELADARKNDSERYVADGCMVRDRDRRRYVSFSIPGVASNVAHAMNHGTVNADAYPWSVGVEDAK